MHQKTKYIVFVNKLTNAPTMVLYPSNMNCEIFKIDDNVVIDSTGYVDYDANWDLACYTTNPTKHPRDNEILRGMFEKRGL